MPETLSVNSERRELDGQSLEAPTADAKKSPGEYFAESFTGYAYGGEVDTPLKDMVQATINTQLTAGKVVAGPVQPATFERVL